ncbi:MAG: DUF481 domain-containing protein [Planctomycetota bacterium]
MAVLLALILGAVPGAMADEVLLDDGSRLLGRIVRLREGRVEVETSFAGTISIEREKVIGLTTENQVAVSMGSGDRILGRLVFVNGQQTVESRQLGTVETEVASITAILDPDSPTPRLRKAQEEYEEREAVLRERHEEEMSAVQERLDRHKPIWTGKLEIGLRGRTGNSERFNFEGALEVKRETADDRLILYATGLYVYEDGSRTDNEIIGGARLEVDLDEQDNKFVYLRGELEYDEFENIDLRTTVTGGAGVVLIKRDDREFRIRGGVGYQHETFDDGTNTDAGVAELGYDLRWDITDELRLTHNVTYIPEITESATEDFRILSRAALEFPIGSSDIWSLSTGVRNEYDNQPTTDTERLDTWYFLNLVCNW